MVYERQDNIVSRQIAGESILVPIRGNLADMQKIFSLDSVAEYIWLNLDGNRTLADIVDDVLDTFDVSKERAENDMSAFIEELSSANLISEVQ